MKAIYHYQFNNQVSMRDVEDTLLLSLMAVESLHGEATVRMEKVFHLNLKQHRLTIDTTTSVGYDLSRIFTGYVIQEFDDLLFQITRQSTSTDVGTSA